MKPLCIDLFCGRFGWSRPWLDLGGYVVGFDLVHEDYHGPVPKGASLVKQDVRTLHGSRFRDASLRIAEIPAALAALLAPSLCSRCEVDRRRKGDTLCRACRLEIDLAYADLPGAS